MKNYLLISLFLYSGVYAQNIDNLNILSGKMLQLSYETEADILSDFLSSANIYRYAKPGEILENSLERRKLELSDGRFGKALHIKHGWSVAKGTNNESGIDLDLTVATMWGDWRTKPHYWGAGKFSGDRGTIAFWVKTDALNPGIVFIQGSISWGRKERDLLRIDLNEDGKLSASIRDIYYQYHQIESLESVWKNNEWQHIAVVYDKAYGLKLYHNNNLIASNWGNDAWWQVPLPGLFSPFLPESHYDEISFYDYPLNADEI
ncbi:MAG: LamG domain-containing protein, partial [Cyclobacteriaceae bacterium]|nr:LamG domain-containing protein [Cyclobacteriaceae bacterium]